MRQDIHVLALMTLLETAALAVVGAHILDRVALRHFAIRVM